MAVGGLVGLVLLENRKDEVVLCADAGVGENRLDNLRNVLFILITKSKNNVLIASIGTLHRY